LPGVVGLLRYLSEPDVGHDPDYTLLARVLWEGSVFDVQEAAQQLPGILGDVIRAAFQPRTGTLGERG
jgi:hypothetical protein